MVVPSRDWVRVTLPSTGCRKKAEVAGLLLTMEYAIVSWNKEQHSGSSLCVEYAIASCNMQCNILGRARVWSMQLHPATQCNILGQVCVWSMQSYPARCSATFTVKLVCGVCNCILQHSATFWVKLACKCFGSRASCSIAYRSVHWRKVIVAGSMYQWQVLHWLLLLFFFQHRPWKGENVDRNRWYFWHLVLAQPLLINYFSRI